MELKGDGVSCLRGDVCRFEGQRATTDNDPVILRGGGGRRSCSGGGRDA